MPSLTRKLVKGRPYYYVRHCQRVDGRPKIVKTTYLGTVEHILQAFAQASFTGGNPRKPKSLPGGDVAALYDVATQLDLAPLIDTHIPKRDQGLSVGQYLLIATLNRAISPTSKAQMAGGIGKPS